MRNTRAAFTIVELLVVVSVVGILIGIAAPAIGSARRSADATLCISRLANIGVMYGMYAGDHNGEWPNLAQPLIYGRKPVGPWGSNTYSVYPVEQVHFWAYPLRVYVGGDGGDLANGSVGVAGFTDSSVAIADEVFSCPHVHRARSRMASGVEGGAWPAVTSGASFLHSPALFTSPSAWETEAPVEINTAMMTVTHSMVASPANKAVLVERKSYHDARSVHVDMATNQMFNVLAADAHVERRSASEAAEPALVTSVMGHWIDNKKVPYLTTKRGARGRDW